MSAAGHASLEPAPVGPPLPPTLLELFVRFTMVSLSGFGGVLPFAYRMIVEKRRWMTQQEFTEALAFAQFLPGGNIINLGVLVGQKYRGPFGSLVCVVGLMLAPTILVLALGNIYLRYGQLPAVHNALDGVAAAASGLILATAIKMGRPLLRPGGAVPLAIVAAVFLAVALFGLRLPLVVLVAAPISIAITWWKVR